MIQIKCPSMSIQTICTLWQGEKSLLQGPKNNQNFKSSSHFLIHENEQWIWNLKRDHIVIAIFSCQESFPQWRPLKLYSFSFIALWWHLPGANWVSPMNLTVPFLCPATMTLSLTSISDSIGDSLLRPAWGEKRYVEKHLTIMARGKKNLTSLTICKLLNLLWTDAIVSSATNW